MSITKIREVTVQEVSVLQEKGLFLKCYLADYPHLHTIIGDEIKDSTFPVYTTFNETEEYKFVREGIKYKHCYVPVDPEYIPYPDNECPPLNCGDIIKGKGNKKKHLITGIDEDEMLEYHISVGNIWTTNRALFYDYTLEDGSPIGKRVEV